MKKITYLFISLLILSVALLGCGKSSQTTDKGPDTNKPSTGLANPASVNCEKNGYQLVMRQNKDGGTLGTCVFPDGTECEEWAYFRGECTYAGGSANGNAQNGGFDKCVKDGNPVMESQPRRCRDKRGKMYIENLSKPVTPSAPPSVPVPPTTPEETSCPDTYKPVCAKVQIQCIKAPCNPVLETIDNECLAKQRGNMIMQMVDGKCEKDLNTTCKTDTDCSLPGDYAAMSRCPFQAKCIADSCEVVCPSSHAVK